MNNPFFNLAAEEYLLQFLDCTEQDYIFIYINNPCVVIGRNQNIYEELDLIYCAENEIDICRRISGGGTVYHDLGNINIAFFSSCESHKVNNYHYFMKDLFCFLQSKGIDVYLNERNSIYVGDFKIGGNAQFTNRKNILSHCTLLFDANLDQLEKSIESPFRQIKSKASKSVRSLVKNLSELLKNSNKHIFINELKDYLTNHTKIAQIQLDNEQELWIKKQFEPKFKTFDWVYARSPKCELFSKNEIFHIDKGKVIYSTNNSYINTSFLPHNELKFYFLKK
ncbi:MAG: lipoate--protein ligase family protein [Bacteroidota bacterium]